MADENRKAEIEVGIKVLLDSLEVFKSRLNCNEPYESRVWDIIDQCVEKLEESLGSGYDPPRFEHW